MPVVRNIRVYTAERDSLTVTWEIADTQEDLSLYTVSVWRSGSATGPYDRISQEMNAADYYDFVDYGLNLYSKWREFFYRLRLTRTSDSAYVEFGSVDSGKVAAGADPGGVSSEAPPDLEALESIRRFDLVLREYAGRKVLVLPERTWGQRCGECWDFLKRRKTRSGCMTCWDTGVAGGFYHPTQAYAMKPAGQELVQLTPLFELQPNDQVMIFSSRPRLKPRDLIVDVYGTRWRVLSIGRSEKSWALTRQSASVRPITRDQVEYSIPISQSAWGENSFSAGPMRQSIRATDIDSYYSAVQSLGVGSNQVYPERSEIVTDPEESNADPK